jgi:hypothetical protein
MISHIITTQDIEVSNFLPIFVSSAFSMIFGGFYVGIYTAVKVSVLKQWAMPFAYMFWILTAYCLYIMGSLMHVGEFTAKVLVVAMIGYLLLPHAIYYIQHQVHEKNE